MLPLVSGRIFGGSMRLLAIVVVLAAAVGVFAYFRYGTIAPCGMMRAKIRAQTAQEGGNIGGFLASVTPDGVIDAMIAAQYNKPVTPALCMSVLFGEQPPQPAR